MKTNQFLAAAFSLSTLSAAWPWAENQFNAVKAVEDVGALLFKRQDSSKKNHAIVNSWNDILISVYRHINHLNRKVHHGPPIYLYQPSTLRHTRNKNHRLALRQQQRLWRLSSRIHHPRSRRLLRQQQLLVRNNSLRPTPTPAAISGAQYYKIGDWLTFAWNYTSLSATPTAVDVLASCAANSQLYTLAVNQSAHDTKVLWDTGAYQATATVPLLTNTYTLIIYPADSSISATPKAGYLAVQQTYTFGMYVPQSYTPWTSKLCS
jgi:hypothetical protein